jgi:hypothetical protein
MHGISKTAQKIAMVWSLVAPIKVVTFVPLMVLVHHYFYLKISSHLKKDFEVWISIMEVFKAQS